jgi:hypothetical protein
MDKIFSARLDESVLLEMDRVVHQQQMTKKKFLEQAIHQMAETLTSPGEKDVWEITRGAWKRKESAVETVRQIKTAFRKAYQRHHR